MISQHYTMMAAFNRVRSSYRSKRSSINCYFLIYAKLILINLLKYSFKKNKKRNLQKKFPYTYRSKPSYCEICGEV